MYCYRAVFPRLLKLHKIVLGKLDLSRGSLTQCHDVLDRGLNLHRNIPLRSTGCENTPHSTPFVNEEHFEHKKVS